jgi:putative phosphoesterase
VRLGVISDVHANVHALTAVWNALQRRRADLIVCAGDVVGYGATPGETIAFLERHEVLTTLGSSDARVAYDLGRTLEPRRGVADSILEWTGGVLEEGHIAFLRRLKVSARLTTGRAKARLFHGSPDDPDATLDLDGPIEDLERLLATLRVSLVLCGGSHVPYVRTTPAGVFVNTGSVGLSLNGEPGADCAIIEVTEEGIRPEILKVPYDVKGAIFDVLAWGLPQVVAKVLQTGSMAPSEPG